VRCAQQVDCAGLDLPGESIHLLHPLLGL
jgi:hypothetical protein